jgi:hypothetical protein
MEQKQQQKLNKFQEWLKVRESKEMKKKKISHHKKHGG